MDLNMHGWQGGEPQSSDSGIRALRQDNTKPKMKPSQEHEASAIKLKRLHAYIDIGPT